ncbi:MAG: Alpha-D-glucose 1-phosphate phosphatase YihX [Chlamydiae bacterium]|nr:Alpha-D-glucose 1-phosphate phosphatase YihX [Chlamydiota bacterium]
MRYLFCLLLLCSSLVAAPPKVVIFDYGGVVAKVDRRPVIGFLSESLDIPYRKVKKDFSSEKFYIALNRSLNYWEHYSHKQLSRDWIEELERHKRMIVQPTLGMQDLILMIKNQGIQVALLSNTNTHRARFIESMGGYDLFDPVLLSCFLGVRKPHPKIYKKLLKNLKYPAKDCLFVDNQAQNVEAGKKMGINGIVFESVDQLAEALKQEGIELKISHRGTRSAEKL